jgi:ubiquinone biosynthesis protein UbiJ
MSKYDTMSINELEAELRRLHNRYDDLEEVITFHLTHSSAHIGSGEVRQDQETLKDLRDEIAAVDKRLASLRS